MINTWLNVQVNISFLNQHFSNYGTLSINYWMPINYRALNYVVREALKNKSSQSLFLYLNIISQLRRIVVSLGCGVDDAWDGGTCDTRDNVPTRNPVTRTPSWGLFCSEKYFRKKLSSKK